ncbi:hypothetical protein LY78DRAFT_725000 [Colletotrichum sublineola]|uniref:C3H1-type domain-containing protein n=1 Tax=Colletotrichum sublineola TaxID=1173701 RepID=A0A066XXL7_COLSU|nr:hypothetical protein LY78DRAFT_725000 [Colletotrichum sublineola]KDN70526.1 hypothetical protein CSUB01_05062 [Colletotrichum sublineola]
MNVNVNDDCLLFVDDSNVWIEAQKFAASGNTHMPKLADGDRDPRLRIDIGKLVNTLCNGRNQCQSYIYGSRPPPNDLVWDQYKKCRFKTKIYDRGANGKEKEVDNSMAVDMSEEAVELRTSARFSSHATQKKDRTIFIVITGDRDMLPAVKKVLRCGIRVELWEWDSGMAKEYLKERNNNILLSVKSRDTIFSHVSFTNYRSTRNTRMVLSQTIVLCEPGDSIGQTWDESFVAKMLLDLGRLFYITRPKAGTEIFAEFPRVSNIEAIVHQAEKLFSPKITIISWPIYASRFNKDLSVVVETSNMFSPLENDGGPRYDNELGGSPSLEDEQTEAQVINRRGGDPDDEEGWQRVQSRSRPDRAHALALRRSQRCSRGQHCGDKGDCGYQHTEKEMARFRENPNLDFKRWKTRRCVKSECRKGERCPFAHSKQDAWCLPCNDQGHFTDECRTSGL